MDINNSFTYHSPNPDQIPKYQELREAGKDLANAILNLCPESPETTIAIRNVEQAIMWANKSIACNE